MMMIKPLVLLSLLGLLLQHSTVAGAEPTGFRVGVASVDITPVMGTPMAGYYHPRGADGVLDPLFSKALVIESAGEAAVFVTLDLIGVTRELTDRARAEIERTTGLKGSQVMISATHAHTGPELANRGKRVENLGGNSALVTEFSDQLPGKIAKSIQDARSNLRPAQLSYARGVCDNLSFNRRYYMRDGTVGWNPGRLNPNIVMPAGPNDPELGILIAEEPGPSNPLKTRATFVNFAMHPDTTGGSKFSADWPGALSRALAGYHGSNHITLVGNGACGNVNHCDFSWQWLGSGPHEQYRIGTILAAAVFQTYKALRPLTNGVIRARAARVELALPEISPEDIASAKQVVNTTTNDRGANFMRLVKAYRTLDVTAREGKPHSVEVQAIAVGRELAWVGLPGEVFAELGIALKKRSPFMQTFVVELANENIGYIPDRRSFAEGNYEPESARCAPGSGEKLVDAAVESLIALYKDAAGVDRSVPPAP